ncbi:MAG: V-type ATP synthase subunit I [Brevinema sp.]
MAISKMKKLTFAVINSLRDQLLKELQALSAVHVDSLIEDEITESSWYEGLNTVSMDVSMLEEQRKELSNALSRITDLFDIAAPSFEITTSDMMQHVSHKYNLADLTQQLHKLDNQTKENEALIHNAKLELDQVQRWSSTIDSMSPIHGTNSVIRGLAGHISESVFFNLSAELEDITDLAEIIVCWVQDKEVYCYVIADTSVWEEVSAVLRNFSFNTIQITRRTGLINDIIYSLQSEIQQAQIQYDLALKEWEHFSHKLNDLALLHDILEIQIQQTRASALGVATGEVSFFRAWVPEDYMPKVEAILSIYHKSIDISIEDPSEEEYPFVPVLLKNNALTRPFSALTTMYGTPMYGRTVDPTPHLSVFYFIFYGICLGDALYGAVLAIFSLLMMFKNRANSGMSNFFALLAWSGFSAVIAGVIFGSYAGDLFTKYIPIPFLKNISFSFSDGMGFFDKPLFVLFVSLLLGAVQLWYGQWIKFFVALKNDGIEAIFNQLPWLILLAGFFAWAIFAWIAGLAGLNLVSQETIAIFFLLIKIGSGLVILNNVRIGFQKGLVSGLVGPLAGAWELYGISGYLSNLLSYARLLALGLSSGIIANVFNDLGSGVIEGLFSISPILSVFGIMLLLSLHIFNLVLGGFGAFVHALRLQFVEFFGQFIEGGGKDFAPLICKGTHYTVK